MAGLALAACAPGAAPPPGGEAAAPVSSALSPDPGAEVLRAEAAPPGAPPGSCWARDIRPALVETVTERTAVPAADGAGTVWQGETRQRILREREEILVQTPCPEVMDRAFVASLQRALAVRGFYRGPVTGVMDGPTRSALRRFQQLRGLDSAVLSIESARALGLLAIDPAEF